MAIDIQSRRLAEPIRIDGHSGLDMASLRHVAKSDPQGFMRVVQKSIDDGHLSLSSVRDLKALYQAFADIAVQIEVDDMGMKRAITTSAFPVLTGNIVVKAINDAYQAVPTIGDQLVTELDDAKAVTVIARIAPLDNHAEMVPEGEDFPEVGVSEETVEIKERPNGRMLRITKQTIERNDIANIVSRINALGKFAATFVEKLTLKRVIDLYGSGATPAAPYAYNPSGSGTQLYNSTDDNPGTRAPSGTRYTNNALADETDLDNVRGRLALHEDDNGNPILIPMQNMIVLVPDALISTLSKIKGSETLVSTVNANVINPYGPRGIWSGWRPLSTPFLDQWSTNAWYMGDFKQQFTRKWALRMEYVTLGEGTESFLRSRVAFQARVAWNCEVGATDYVYVIQSLSGTTPPS